MNPCHEASDSFVSVTWKDGTQTRRCTCGDLFTARHGVAWKYRPEKRAAPRSVPVEETLSSEDYL